MIKVNSNELINNFDKYLQYVEEGNDILIVDNGIVTAKLTPYKKERYLSDSLVGVLNNDYNLTEVKKEMYEIQIPYRIDAKNLKTNTTFVKTAIYQGTKLIYNIEDWER